MSLSQHVKPHRAPAPLGILLSIAIAAVGGFVGGMLMEHGPTYLNVHVTQPVLGQAEQPAEFFSVAPTEPALFGEQTPTKAGPLARGAESRIVVHAHDAAYIVVQDGSNTDWGTGKIRSTEDDGLLVTMRQQVKPAALPVEHRAWLGAEVTLFDARGYACSGTVERFELLEQYAGDGMTLETWDGAGPLLVAKIARSKGNCNDAVWARHADLETPSIGRLSRGTKKERREARRAFRSTTAYREVQQYFEDHGHKGKWDAFWDGALSIRVVRSPEQELVFVDAAVGSCGEFNAQLGSVFERQEDGTLLLVPSEDEFLAGIEAAADMDGDGDLDFVFQGDGYDRYLMLSTETGLNVESRNLVAIYYCRC